MKAPFFILLLCLGSLLPASAESPKAGDAPPGRDRETRMLRHLLSMPPAELAALRQTIEHIEQMSPEDKEQLRERIGQLEQMPPDHVQAMREQFNSIDPETRERMRARWLKLSPEERREWRLKLREMNREERHEVFQKEGFLPPHNRAKGKPGWEAEKDA